MEYEFLLLISTWICSIFFVFFSKGMKKAILIWYIGCFLSFISPSVYIYFGGENYRSYGINSASTYMLLGSIVNVINIICTYISYRVLGKSPNLNNYHLDLTKRTLNYFWFFILISLVYVVYFWNLWPLVNAMKGNIIDRPDTVKGGFKFFFTISTIFMIVIPTLFFSLLKGQTKKNSIVMFFLVSILLVIGGNKGIFMYFCLFYWFYFLNFKINLRFVMIIILLLSLYLLMKGVSDFGLETVIYAIESPLRRLFVAQGIAIPIRIEMLNAGILDYTAYESIKFVVFEFTYGYSPGSMPVVFFGDLFVHFGFIESLILSFIPVLLIHIFANLVDRSANYSYLWLYFFTVYILTMSGFSLANAYRMIIVVSMFLFIRFLIKGQPFNENHNVS
ncbi:hypothetical protein BCU53_013290 [Vibrio lentus]|uniref:hypothetical protein n=1 Tax=Vibrio lentus TaxID=136468 RepID=UPI000CA8DD14|nr:hypothetical protein [Vibrio lentus]PMI05609.1 hypothetical protein BCU53_13830 [Vibrio lentus]